MHFVLFEVLHVDGAKRTKADMEQQVNPCDVRFSKLLEQASGKVKAGRGSGDRARVPRVDGLVSNPVTGRCAARAGCMAARASARVSLAESRLFRSCVGRTRA